MPAIQKFRIAASYLYPQKLFTIETTEYGATGRNEIIDE